MTAADDEMTIGETILGVVCGLLIAGFVIMMAASWWINRDEGQPRRYRDNGGYYEEPPCDPGPWSGCT